MRTKSLGLAVFSRTFGLQLVVCAFACGSGVGTRGDEPDAQLSSAHFAEIQVVDQATKRGVPLVELETVNHLTFVTDNAGRIALLEPELMNRDVFFHVRSHGYELPRDGFGFAGTRLTLKPGSRQTIAIKRVNLAERLCRLTGEGRYRDSQLLGYPPPDLATGHPGLVSGQDSIQAAVYRDKVYCFWGDTERLSYPLGLYRMAGATMPIPNTDDPKFDAAKGLPYNYFVDPQTRFARAMMPLAERPDGVIWVESVFTVPDATGQERLVGHYSRRKGLGEVYEQGIALFNDEKAVFESATTLPLDEKWRLPSGVPIRFDDAEASWMLFGSPSPNVRVRATLEAVLEPTSYEAYSCVGIESDVHPGRIPEVDTDGRPKWRWHPDRIPTTAAMELEWLKAGLITDKQARFTPRDIDHPTEHIHLHRGSVRWNEYRKRWILIAGQINGSSSHLGEVWYAESNHPTGPFLTAMKIVTHDRQTFYNVVQHPFLDQHGGQTIHFEGTYTNEFSGNQSPTARYDYNQILYRLDLTDSRLRTVQP